jgi:menaquinone-dependent protoporphyrinogen oxidase
MEYVIVYRSQHGTTGKVAEHIRNKIGPEKCDIINLKDNKNPDISGYETVMLGGSVHAGQLNTAMKKFITAHKDLLLQKRLGLFLCGMEIEKADLHFSNAWPEDLRNHASVRLHAGGEFLFEKMNFFERAIVKKIAGIESSRSEINYIKINRFAEEIAGTH